MRRLVDILRLIRFPLMTTTTGDVLVGVYCLGGWGTWLAPSIGEMQLLCLILSSASLYAFGMATNDIFDRKRDREIHPERPLPSGRMSLGTAWIVAVVFLAAGLGLSIPLGRKATLIASGMVLAMLLYNGLLKRYPDGSYNMGTIRGLNVLYGWSALQWANDISEVRAMPAAIVFGYIALTTYLSTAEEEGRRRTVILSLLGILGLVPATFFFHEGIATPAALPILGIALWRLGATVADASTRSIGQTVRFLLLGLYFLDAHFLFVEGRDGAGLIVLGLLIPALILSRLLRVSS